MAAADSVGITLAVLRCRPEEFSTTAACLDHVQSLIEAHCLPAPDASLSGPHGEGSSSSHAGGVPPPDGRVDVDILLLPELGTCGYSYMPQDAWLRAESLQAVYLSPTLQRLEQLGRRCGGSLPAAVTSMGGATGG